ncbi:DUF3017 domain-containing protein [Streptomyces sp. NPDC006270]|uniref:DUF3017 domain-containing protein n=1 Tax=Streptomyces sp. NPDC006270 TaxID=3364741 RepID=UPI0036CC3EF1
MGAGTSPADPAPAGRAADEPDGQAEPDGQGAEPDGRAGSDGRGEQVPDRTGEQGEPDGRDVPVGRAGSDGRGEQVPDRTGEQDAQAPDRAGEQSHVTEGRDAPGGPDPAPGDAATTGRPRRSRRFPRFTRDTARPEGGGRAASGDAPAPARQWPLLTVLCAAGLGLLIVVLDPFDQAFRIGTILMGGALIAGAVLRWVVPSVGMLAVRSRFTDLVTYGLMGTLIVLLALVAQPAPWLDVPILEDAVRFTIR